MITVFSDVAHLRPTFGPFATQFWPSFGPGGVVDHLGTKSGPNWYQKWTN